MSSRYTGGVIFNAPGGWSAQFSGSNYLTVPDNSAWVVDSDYTVEFWCKATSFPGQYNNIFNQRSSGTQYWGVNWDTSLGWCFFWNNGAGETKISRNQNSPLNTWVHFAFVKSGTTGYMFLNGVQAGATFTIGTISDFASLLYIGVWPTISDYFAGYLSNFRIVKGTALYTANFTPPTGALLPITNTALLTCRYPTIVDGSTNAFTITNTGTVTVATANPFPTSALPNPALGVAGNGVYTMSQYAALKTANLWPAYDPYYKNVALNLHGNAGAVLPFNTDASTNNFQVTQVGDTRPSNWTPFITNGYWSNLFVRSSSQYLTVSNSGGQFSFGTGAFTIECWVNLSSLPSSTGYPASYWIFGGGPVNSNPGIDFYINNTQIGFNLTDFTSPTAIGNHGMSVGTWYHVAVVRGGGSNQTVSIYVNGTRVATASSVTATADAATTGIAISAAEPSGATSGNFDGYISNHRIVKGTAVYDPTQSTLTVPTAPLTAITNTQLLTCQSNRFVDNSSNAFTITTSGSPSVNSLQPFTAPTGTSAYGSGYFDGSGDYLRAPTGYLTGVTTGNFTVEGWWNFGDFTVRTTYFQRLWSFGTGLANDVTLNVDTSGNLVFRVNDSIIASQSSGAMKLNSWNHVALVRSSGTVTIYLNGTSVASAANSSNISGQAGNPFYLGCESDGAGGYFYGYCSNVRITNTAVYTTTFTPSTTPLTAISGTSLLTVQTNAPSQNNTFLDSSTNNFTITRNGNTTQGTFTPYGSNWSAYIGSSNYLYFANNAALSFGTGDFCVEAWVYKTTAANEAIIDSRATQTATPWAVYVDGSNFPYFYEGTLYTSTVAITLNAWNHVAVTRSSGTLKVFVNGVQGYSATVTTNLDRSGGNQVIAANVTGGANYWSGYLSNLRIVKGSAVYTSAFTPSTAPLTAISGTSLLTFQSNRFIDNSSNAFSLTVVGSPSVQRFSPFTTAYSTSVIGGSGYFDGSGDYLVAPNNSAFDLSTADFTVECWYYFLTTGATQYICVYSNGTAQNSNYQYVLSVSSAGVVQFQNLSGSGQSYVTGATIPANTWSHIAATRTGTSGVVYVNGVGTSGTLYATANTPSGATLKVGSDHDGSLSAKGNITDFRIVKGTRVYTANFTPPTAPLTAITNTSLLLSYTNAAISDNAMMNDLETVGNAQISTSVKKYGTGSMYFDGSGDYLLAKSNDVFNFGTGDFTVEFWINASASGSYTQVIGTIVSSAENGTWRIGNRFNSLNQIYFARGTGSGFNEFQASVNVNDGAWHHVAVVRYSGTVTIYADGVASASSSITGTCTSANPLYVGYNGRDNAYITGYLDDVRITKGVARYTANFTPPTSQLQDQ